MKIPVKTVLFYYCYFIMTYTVTNGEWFLVIFILFFYYRLQIHNNTIFWKGIFLDAVFSIKMQIILYFIKWLFFNFSLMLRGKIISLEMFAKIGF